MENKGRSEVTEAQLQIERLKKLKEQKEQQAEKEKSEAFKFIEKPARKLKTIRTVRMSKANFDAVHSAVNRINKNTKSKRLTKDKLINLLVARFMELEIDYASLKDKDAFIRLLKNLDIK